MDRDKIVQNLYKAFKNYSRPENFTDYEHCPECNDHNETMKSASLETLNSEHLGSPGYNPFNFLTTEALGHYLPRLLELAITGVKTKHDDLFLHDFLFHLAPGKDYDRFKEYNEEQVSTILAALRYAHGKYRNELVDSFYDEDMDLALEYWNTRSENL